MKLSELSAAETLSYMSGNMSGEGLPLKTGPFNVSISSKIPSVIHSVRKLYGEAVVATPEEFIDYHVKIKKPGSARSYLNPLKPQVQFYFDGTAPFKPLPLQQAFPMLEWGMNLCISSTANQYMIIHAAAVEMNGAVFILPGPSGSGKSTLCATLINSGWRLLTDELTLVSLNDGLVYPLTRPVSLKNESINIIQNRFPDSIFNEITNDTAKGSVSHMKAPTASVAASGQPSRAKFIIFPKYISEHPPQLTEFSPAQTFMQLIENSFNYSFLAEQGFKAMNQLVEQCKCYHFNYSSLDDAIRIFKDMAHEHTNA